jgi:uncharacterized protein YdeI (YjbR/CyaY-like superfamily)
VSEPTFFAGPADFRAWLDANHATAAELSVGFWKTGTGRPSMTWPQSVDQALCFGWIDGVRHRIDEAAYRIRFTPRKPRSAWSQVNVRRFAELEALGLVTPAGRVAFEAGADKTPRYSYEKPAAELAPEHLARFQADAPAWAGFQAMAPWYRKQAIHSVTSARTEATRERRLAALMAACAEGRKI